MNVNVRNVSNNCPLHYFCSKWPDPDLSILETFFQRKADVNVLNDSKETPLLKAITNTRIRKVLMQKLLEHGADPDILNTHNEGMRSRFLSFAEAFLGVLHYAARLARVDLIQLLLKYCTNLRVKGAEGSCISLYHMTDHRNGATRDCVQVCRNRRSYVEGFLFIDRYYIRESTW